MKKSEIIFLATAITFSGIAGGSAGYLVDQLDNEHDPAEVLVIDQDEVAPVPAEDSIIDEPELVTYQVGVLWAQKDPLGFFDRHYDQRIVLSPSKPSLADLREKLKPLFPKYEMEKVLSVVRMRKVRVKGAKEKEAAYIFEPQTE
jgi:hypothetical protein